MSRKIPKLIMLIGSKLILWNIIGLVFVKLIFSFSAFQLATLLDSVLTFSSTEIVSFTNQARADNNLPSLKSNTNLDVAAREKLQDMISGGYFAHVSPDGIAPWFWITKNNYKYIYAGENLALGFTDAESTIKAWMDSSTHRENILNPNYNEIGVAVGTAELEGIKGILVVQMFGRGVTLSVPTQATAGSGTNLANLQETPIAFQQVSTDKNIKPVMEITEVNLNSGDSVKDVVGYLNNIYSVYALIAVAFSIIIILYERSRRNVLNLSLNAAVLALAVYLPPLITPIIGIIF